MLGKLFHATGVIMSALPAQRNMIQWSTPVEPRRFHDLSPAQLFKQQRIVDDLVWFDRSQTRKSWSYLARNPVCSRDMATFSELKLFEYARLFKQRTPRRSETDGPPFCG